MNILFIDDTEQFNKEYVGIGGVIFHDDYLNSLFSLFNQKKTSHSIPSEEEIKWSPPKNSWIAKNLINGNRISAYSDILSLVRSFKGRIDLPPPKESSFMLDWKIRKGATDGQEALHTGADSQQAA